MSSTPHVEKKVASLNVGELEAMIRQTIRKELTEILFAVSAENDDLRSEAPPIRDIDKIIVKMQATGKYNQAFLNSLRKGMETSQIFKTPKAKSEI